MALLALSDLEPAGGQGGHDDRTRDFLNGFGQLLDERDGLVGQGAVSQRDSGGSHAVVGQLVEEDQARSRRTEYVGEETLRRALRLVVRAHLFVERRPA